MQTGGRQRQGVTARTAADIQNPLPRLQGQQIDQRPNLLIGALGERVAEISRTHEAGDRFEPVLACGHDRNSAGLAATGQPLQGKFT